MDVRLIAATNRDVVDAIRRGEFREDLFHRLNVMQFRPPPLRERGGDILLLAAHFLRGFNARLGKNVRAISEAARAALVAHTWPANIRELRNVIERAVILESSQEVQPSSLPDFEVESRLRQAVVPSAAPRLSNLGDTLIAFEREMVSAALQQHDGNLAAAAAQLGLTLEALQFRLGRLQIGPATPLPGGPSSKGSS